MADSGLMYNIRNDRYLVLELFNGNTYHEEKPQKRNYLSQQQPDPLMRNEFGAQKIVFSLASFDLKRTKEELFSSNRLMKNSQQLKVDVDSMKTELIDRTEEVKEHSFKFFEYHLQDIVGVYKERAIEREAKKRSKEEEQEWRDQQEIEKANNQKTDSLSNKTINTEKYFDTTNIRLDSSSIKEITSKLNESKVNSFEVKKIPNKKSIPKPIAKREVIRKSVVKAKPEIEDVTESDKVDSVVAKPTFEENILVLDSVLNSPSLTKKAFNRALTSVRYVKNNMMMHSGKLNKLKTEINKFQLEQYKKLSYAITILIMFFIGAPLGAIIKRGGLGIPVLISLSFFILFYVISMMCEKWTRTDVMNPILAAWMANIILFPVGLFFMKQARNDARLFEVDFYIVVFLKLKSYFFSIKSKFIKPNSLN